MSEKMTVAEALAELKRISKILPRRYANIRRYSSKRRDSKDEIDHQKDFVKEQRQSAEDLIRRWIRIKIAIAGSNLQTTITWKKHEMSIAQALLFKSNVAGRNTSVKSEYEALYGSFTAANAKEQINNYVGYKGLTRLDEEELEDLNLVPELYYDEREIQGQLEDLIDLESKLDALIDASNHKTVIEF